MEEGRNKFIWVFFFLVFCGGGRKEGNENLWVKGSEVIRDKGGKRRERERDEMKGLSHSSFVFCISFSTIFPL